MTRVMADWLLEAWSFQTGQPSCTTVMPDGCQDLLCITDVDGRSQWKWAPLADGAYQVQCETSERFQGWRLLPGCQVDIDGLLQALSGRDATYDPVGVLGDFVRLSEGTTQALRALADCSSVQLACRQLGVAERSLFRRLLKESGRSPVYWRQLARARRAAQGLRSGMPLAHLATEHGYADQAHFSREMRRWFGASPQALRINSAALDAIELAGY